MDSIVGQVFNIWDIPAPKRGTGPQADENYQRDFKKFQEEQASGIKKKIAVEVREDYQAGDKTAQTVVVYEAKIKDTEISKIGDRIVMTGTKYSLNGKVGFNKNPKIEVISTATAKK